MGVGDILDETFRLYRRHFLTFVVATAVVVVPLAVLSTVLSLLIGIGSARFELRTPDDVTILLLFLVFAAAVGLVSGLGYMLNGGAVIRLASDAAMGRPSGIGAAYRAALDKLGSLLWAGFLISLAVGLLAITCIGLPVAAYFGTGWAVALPVILLEGLGGRAAMSRSAELVDGHRWRVLGAVVLLAVLVWILVSVPAGIVGVIMGLILAVSQSAAGPRVVIEVVNTFVSAVAQSLFGALTWISLVVIYYELRVRKEAFDLERLAAEGEGSPPPLAPPPSLDA